MSKRARQSTVEQLTTTLSSSPTLYVTDFSGMTVEKMTEFRRQLRAVGARYVVVKNTLARRALVAGNVTALPGEALKGPVGIVITGADPLPAAKVVTDFAKANDRPAIKVGMVDGKAVEASYVKRLGELPGREALLGQLVGALNGMLYQVVGSLEALREKRLAEGSN